MFVLLFFPAREKMEEFTEILLCLAFRNKLLFALFRNFDYFFSPKCLDINVMRYKISEKISSLVKPFR